MNKTKKKNRKKVDTVKSVNNSIRTSVRKLNPILKSIVGKKVDKYKDDPKKIPIKTWSRKSTILPDFVGVSFQIYNGKKFIPITVSEDMVCLLYTSPSPRD